PRGPRRRRGRGERAPRAARLAELHGPLPRRPDGRARPLHRLLAALRHQPRRLGQRPGGAGRGEELRARAARGRAGRPHGPVHRRRLEAQAAADEMTWRVQAAAYRSNFVASTIEEFVRSTPRKAPISSISASMSATPLASTLAIMSKGPLTDWSLRTPGIRRNAAVTAAACLGST